METQTAFPSPDNGVGIITHVKEIVSATASDGSIRLLATGNTVHLGDFINAEAGGTIHITFRAGGFATLGSGDSLTVDSSVLADAARAASDAAPVPCTGGNDIIEALQQRIAEGEDPSEVAEHTAEGQKGSKHYDEGSSFVIIAQNAIRGEITAGFDTAANTPSGEFPAMEMASGSMGLSLPDHSEPDYDSRFVMYMERDNLPGEDGWYVMEGKAQAGKHSADSSARISSLNGYGTATIMDGKVVYVMNGNAREALAAGGTLFDYVTYTDTNGLKHTIKVILTTDNHHNSKLETNDVIGESHLSIDVIRNLDVTSSEGDDVHDYGAFFDSSLNTGSGNDTVNIGGASNQGILRSDVKLGNGNNVLSVHVNGTEQAVGVNNSSLSMGNGSNRIDISVRAESGNVWGMFGSNLTGGDGNNTVNIDISTSGAGNVYLYGMSGSTIALGMGKNNINIAAEGASGFVYGITNSSIVTKGTGGEINISARGGYTYGVRNSTIHIDGNDSLMVKSVGWAGIQGLYSFKDETVAISRSDGSAANANITVIAYHNDDRNSATALSANAGEIIANTTGNFNAYAYGYRDATAAYSRTINYTTISDNGHALLDVKAGNISLFAGYDESGRQHADTLSSKGISTVVSSVNHDATQRFSAHKADGSGSITVKSFGAGDTSATYGIMASAGTNSAHQVVGTAKNVLTADKTISIEARSQGNSSSSGQGHGIYGMSSTASTVTGKAENILRAKHVNIFAGLSEYKGSNAAIKGKMSESAVAIYSKGPAAATSLNEIHAQSVNVRAETVSEKSSAAFKQMALAMQSIDYGSNRIYLSGSGESRVSAVLSASAGENGQNTQTAYAMYASGAGAENSITENPNGDMASGKLVIEATADSANSTVYGLFAEKGGSNTAAVSLIDIITEGDIQFGMVAEGVNSSNTLVTQSFTHFVSSDVSEAWSLFAENGGYNFIGTPDGSSVNAAYTLEGGLMADASSRNVIKTGWGDDLITIKGDLIGESTGSSSPYDYSNWLDTGGGNDTVYLYGSVQGSYISLGSGNDHLYLYNGSDTLSNSWLDGGNGWDVLHLSGNYSLASITGKQAGSNNVLTGFEEFDLGGNDSRDVLAIDAVLSDFGNLGDLKGFRESAGSDLLGILSKDDSQVLFVSGDDGNGKLGIRDVVDFGSSGNWSQMDGSVSLNGVWFNVYYNAGTNDYVAIQNGLEVNGIGF